MRDESWRVRAPSYQSLAAAPGQKPDDSVEPSCQKGEEDDADERPHLALLPTPENLRRPAAGRQGEKSGNKLMVGNTTAVVLLVISHETSA